MTLSLISGINVSDLIQVVGFVTLLAIGPIAVSFRPNYKGWCSFTDPLDVAALTKSVG